MRYLSLFIIITAPAIAGCLGVGIETMTPAQINATNGMATCTEIKSIYGTARAITVNADQVRKNDKARGSISIAADCTVTITNDSAPVFPPPKP